MDPSHIDPMERDFVVVLIPCDNDAPVQEVTVHQPAGEAIGCMLKFASKVFSANRLSASQASQVATQMRSQEGAKDLPEDVLAKAAQLDLAEVVPLCPNRAEFGYIGVNLIVDDKGVGKQLAVNVRACGFARSCGLVIEVRGDAFIARQFDNDAGFHRLDFRLSDMASDAPWVNAIRAARGNPDVSLRKDNAQAARDAGNAAFKKKQYAEALQHYESGINAATGAETKSALLSNASACLLALHKPEAALQRAREAVDARRDWFKAHGRVGDALVALGRHAEAVEAYSGALRLAPEAADVQQRLDEARKAAGVNG